MQLLDLWEAHPATLVMYHGTRADAAKRIAQAGFSANPDRSDRQYSGEGEDDPYLASLDGAYFTDKLYVAVRYAWDASQAFGDWPALVVAHVPLSEAVPDEDVISLAMQEAMRQTRNPDAFVRAFHRNLVQDRPIPIQRDLMIQLRDAYTQFEAAEDTEADGVQYRRLLDQMAHAYAAMVFDTHPVYLGGNHTVRLPNGLPPQNIISITQFGIEFRYNDARFPFVAGVLPIQGKALAMSRLRAAVADLKRLGVFA
jgi:hypothetical protein